MGAYYGSIHIRSNDIEEIIEIVKRLAAQEKLKFLISPCINGWISVYSSERGQNPTVAEAIAQQFSGHLLYLSLYDDDLFDYIYYREHKLVDEYSSNPDYFETIPREEKERLCGKPEVFADLLAELPNNQTTIEEIAEVLTVASEEEREKLYQKSLELLKRLQVSENHAALNELPYDEVFAAAKQFADFAQLFNISNASICYEYLQDDEDEEIERWSEFFHIPDLSIELAHKQREKARINQALTELNISGILLLTVSSPTPSEQFPHQPIFVPEKTGGFFIGWYGHHNQPLEIKHYTAPWNNEPENLDLPLEKNAYVMQISPSGKFLALGHASGSWQATLYDLEEKQLLKTIPHLRATSSVQFTPNEEMLVSRSEEEIVFTSIENLQQIAVIKVGHGSKIAIHPDGRYLLADDGGKSKLAIIDLKTQTVVKVLSTAELDRTAWMASVQRGEGVNAFSANEMIFKMDFSPDGRWLVCAMQQGVRVFEWNEVFSSHSKLPLPIVGSSSEVITVGDRGSRMATTYDVAFDWQRNVILSCGIEGKVKSLDLATGESKVLLEIPGRPAIIQLDLSRDLATFCTHSIHDMFERKPEPIVQIWNYLRLA
ncbi:WD40 repeat domain-containing protein [Nostoc sp. C117]|uniref:WD40 repeat domain-containing protein n=1 Tax=Nostoc sp. C117 TaxID=3349875 RepID=UPI00370D4031